MVKFWVTMLLAVVFFYATSYVVGDYLFPSIPYGEIFPIMMFGVGCVGITLALIFIILGGD